MPSPIVTASASNIHGECDVRSDWKGIYMSINNVREITCAGRVGARKEHRFDLKSFERGRSEKNIFMWYIRLRIAEIVCGSWKKFNPWPHESADYLFLDVSSWRLRKAHMEGRVIFFCKSRFEIFRRKARTSTYNWPPFSLKQATSSLWSDRKTPGQRK